jgi:hypothetical protein
MLLSALLCQNQPFSSGMTSLIGHLVKSTRCKDTAFIGANARQRPLRGVFFSYCADADPQGVAGGRQSCKSSRSFIPAPR